MSSQTLLDSGRTYIVLRFVYMLGFPFTLLSVLACLRTITLAMYISKH